jgi:hypothetical protein
MALSRAEMEVSNAEASVGKLEAVWIKWAKITIVSLLVPIIYGAWIIIVALPVEFKRHHYLIFRSITSLSLERLYMPNHPESELKRSEESRIRPDKMKFSVASRQRNVLNTKKAAPCLEAGRESSHSGICAQRRQG